MIYFSLDFALLTRVKQISIGFRYGSVQEMFVKKDQGSLFVCKRLLKLNTSPDGISPVSVILP